MSLLDGAPMIRRSKLLPDEYERWQCREVLDSKEIRAELSAVKPEEPFDGTRAGMRFAGLSGRVR